MAATGNFEIDPVSYGKMQQQVQEMSKKVDKMEEQIDKLVELANRSKGGLWLGMTVLAVVSSVAGFLGAIFRMKGH